jgi:hypothetical protein
MDERIFGTMRDPDFLRTCFLYGAAEIVPISVIGHNER